MYCTCCRSFAYGGAFFYKENPFNPYVKKPNIEDVVAVCHYCYMACSTKECTKPKRFKRDGSCNHTPVLSYDIDNILKYCIFCGKTTA